MRDAADSVERVAKEILGVPSFAKSDPHRRDVYVIQTFKLRDALLAAYAAGVQSGLDMAAEIEAERKSRRR